MQPPHEKIGVVDTQWVVHQSVPSLGNQVTEALIIFFIQGEYLKQLL